MIWLVFNSSVFFFVVLPMTEGRANMTLTITEDEIFSMILHVINLVHLVYELSMNKL